MTRYWFGPVPYDADCTPELRREPPASCSWCGLAITPEDSGIIIPDGLHEPLAWHSACCDPPDLEANK